MLYSNRAACYMKLGEFPMAVKDCDKALELSPTFGESPQTPRSLPFRLPSNPMARSRARACGNRIAVKAYTRKGHCQFFMKQYHKCLETYEQGLKVEPNNEGSTKVSSGRWKPSTRDRRGPTRPRTRRRWRLRPTIPRSSRSQRPHDEEGPLRALLQPRRRPEVRPSLPPSSISRIEID